MRTLIVLPLLLTACGGTGLTGIYETTTSTANSTACTGGTAVDGPSHVMVQESSLLGQTILEVKYCTSADPASCDASSGNALVTAGLLDENGNGGIAVGNEVSGKCIIDDISVVASVADDGDKPVITIKGEKYSGEITSTCEASELTSHRSELNCVSTQTLVGKWVAEAPEGESGSLSL